MQNNTPRGAPDDWLAGGEGPARRVPTTRSDPQLWSTSTDGGPPFPTPPCTRLAEVELEPRSSSACRHVTTVQGLGSTPYPRCVSSGAFSDRCSVSMSSVSFRVLCWASYVHHVRSDGGFATPFRCLQTPEEWSFMRSLRDSHPRSSPHRNRIGRQNSGTTTHGAESATRQTDAVGGTEHRLCTPLRRGTLESYPMKHCCLEQLHIYDEVGWKPEWILFRR